MTDQPNITDFPMTEVDAASQIGKGDMTIVIHKDGTVGTLAFDVDMELMKKPREELTEEEEVDVEAMLVQGEKVFALTFAATNPLLMRILIDVAGDPNLVDIDAINKAALRAHRPN